MYMLISSLINEFISVGEDPRFCKRWVIQYPARLNGGSHSPALISAQLHMTVTAAKREQDL